MPSLQKTMKVESWFWQFIVVYEYWKNSLACLSGFFFRINFDLFCRWQDIGTNHQSIPRKWRKIRPLTCLRLRQAETEMGQFSTSHEFCRCMHWWSLMSYILQCVSLCKYSNITAYYILYDCLILVGQISLLLCATDPLGRSQRYRVVHPCTGQRTMAFAAMWNFCWAQVRNEI